MKTTKIRQSAKGQICVVHLPGCRQWDTSTTVLAHKTYPIYTDSPRKCDARAAYACVVCHDILDGRRPYSWAPHEKDAVWAAAIERTHIRLIEIGLMTFVGFEYVQKTLPRNIG